MKFEMKSPIYTVSLSVPHTKWWSLHLSPYFLLLLLEPSIPIQSKPLLIWRLRRRTVSVPHLLMQWIPMPSIHPSTYWIAIIQHQDFYLLSWSLFFCDFILFFLLETKWDLKWIANLIRSTMNMVHPVLRLLHPFDCAYLSMGWNVGRWHHWSWWTEWTQFHVDCISSTYLTVCSVMWLNVIWSDVIQ